MQTLVWGMELKSWMESKLCHLLRVCGNPRDLTYPFWTPFSSSIIPATAALEHQRKQKMCQFWEGCSISCCDIIAVLWSWCARCRRLECLCSDQAQKYSWFSASETSVSLRCSYRVGCWTTQEIWFLGSGWNPRTHIVNDQLMWLMHAGSLQDGEATLRCPTPGCIRTSCRALPTFLVPGPSLRYSDSASLGGPQIPAVFSKIHFPQLFWRFGFSRTRMWP